MRQKTYILKIIFASLALLFIFASPVFALEVEDYPTLPLLPALSDKSDFPQYVAYFFGFGIYIAALLTMISFAYGAVRFISSAGNPSTAGDAKSQMISSIIGLILVLSSALILRTINPQLTNITLTPLNGVGGVFYVGAGEKKAAPMAEADYANVPEGYNNILYECDPATQDTAPLLLVWQYQQKNFAHKPDYSDVSVREVRCGGRASISPSFTMSFESPGVYYFTGPGCSGYRSQVIGSGGGELFEPFFKNIKSIKIVNDPDNAMYFGAIFHQTNDGSGLCQDPIEKVGCQPVSTTVNPASVDVYIKNSTPLTSGDGVKFYSEEWGWNTGVQGGIYTVSKEQIPSTNWTNSSPANMTFSFRNTTVPPEYQTSCPNFKVCHGSIKVQGGYLAVVYSAAAGQTNLNCQVFKKDVPNLNETQAVPEGFEMKRIQIIPVK